MTPETSRHQVAEIVRMALDAGRTVEIAGLGTFQVTAQELSTILRHDHKPAIFLINNGGYTIERGYLGKTETYNDIANWSYADLPKVFRRDTPARSFVVKTVKTCKMPSARRTTR